MPFATTEARLTLALLGLLLVVVGEIERGAAWSAWLPPIGLVCVLLALIFGLRAGTRVSRQRIAVVGILAGGAAVHDAELKITEVGGAVILAASVTAAWNQRASRRREQPADFRVTDALLRERFASLDQGPGAERWRAFLAQREPGDELWYVHDPAADPGEHAGAEFLVLLRPGALGETGAPPEPDERIEPGERIESTSGVPGRPGREVARFLVRSL